MAVSARNLVQALLLTDSTCRAFQGPVALETLHCVAYLAEALSPVWGLRSHRNEVLKRQGSPFFPQLQESVDDLIFRGVITVTDLDATSVEATDSTTQAAIEIDRDAANQAISLALAYSDEREASELYLEVALAAARAPDLRAVVALDASYSDPTIGLNRLVELGTVADRNSAGLASRIGELIEERTASRGEMVSLYIGHLSRIASRRAG